MSVRIINGDCRWQLATLEANSIQCCVTSPPYFGLRDYGMSDQIGLEETPEEYITEMVSVFREVRKVLRADGTCWINIGDSYAATTKGSSGTGKNARNIGSIVTDRSWSVPPSCKPKDLIGIPWMLAFALRADGWYLRQDIIWHKPSPMPESVTDRCTKAHEYVFLLSKSARYFYDADAISEKAICAGAVKDYTGNQKNNSSDPNLQRTTPRGRIVVVPDTRNKRSVWTIASKPYSGAHFATMPPELAETCIKAGSKPGDTILDPFGGAGTTGMVADRLGRNAVLIELNPTYAALAKDRIAGDAGMFAETHE